MNRLNLNYLEAQSPLMCLESRRTRRRSRYGDDGGQDERTLNLGHGQVVRVGAPVCHSASTVAPLNPLGFSFKLASSAVVAQRIGDGNLETIPA